jgi:hypothetical protein
MWRVVQGEKIDGEILEAFRTIERQRDSALAKLKEK